jgi:hypothetical protein
VINVYIYFKNGNVDIYPVENVWKAREHAEKIWVTGYRMMVGNRMEWFAPGPEWISKICWDIDEKGDFLSTKYESSTQSEMRQNGKT